MVEEVEIDLYDIVDRYEIATLLTRRVSAAAFEQFHFPGFTELVEAMHRNRGHPALV